MIERIIDKYYAKKYQELITDVSMYYYVDLKFKRKDGITKVYIKKKKYKNYSNFEMFYNGEAFYRLINYKESKKYIQKCIETYLEMEKE